MSPRPPSGRRRCLAKLALCAALLALFLSHLEQASAADRGTLRALRGDPVSVAAFADGQTLVVFAHQDDDLLWMFPFWPVAARFLLSAYPAAPVFEDLVESLPPELAYGQRWTPIWSFVDNDIWADVFTDRCKRAPIVSVATVKAHLKPFFTPSIRRVVTHNNWGEYGHTQHRMVNIAVRQLAVEGGLDVWALGTRMAPSAREPSEYVDVADGLGLPIIEGYFDPELFRQARAAYLVRRPAASTPALAARFSSWSATLWTWPDEPEAFPMGWRPFVKLVDHGVDLTAQNAAVSRLENEMPVVNDCLADPAFPRPSVVETPEALAAEGRVRAEVESALQEYARLLQALDAAALSALYTPDGELLEPGMESLKGPEAIRKFLESFGDVRIESSSMTSESVEVWGDAALQWGRYAQRVAAPGQPLGDFSGRFAAQWKRQTTGRWLLRRLLVQPSR